MTDVVTEVFAAGQQKTLLGGLFFKIIDSVDPVDVEIVRSGFPSTARNIPQGYELGPLASDRRVELFRVRSATAQQVRFLVGDDIADLDRFDAQVAIEQPNTIVTLPDAVVGVGVSTPVPANANRKIVHVRALPTNLGLIRFAEVGQAAVNRGMFLGANDSASFTTTAAIEAIATVAAQGLAIFEEVRV